VRRRPLGWGTGLPTGSLEFDECYLTIEDRHRRLQVDRGQVRVIRLSLGLSGRIVSVVYDDGAVDPLYFCTFAAEPIRTELRRRGWPTDG
jgi:hypothetical protein